MNQTQATPEPEKAQVMTDKSITPEFSQAVSAYLRLVEQAGPDHPQAQQAFQIAMHHTPRWMLDEMGDMARQMGLMPEPDYLEDGTPVYRSDAIAEKLGITETEVKQAVDKLVDERQALSLPTLEIPAQQVYRRQ